MPIAVNGPGTRPLTGQTPAGPAQSAPVDEGKTDASTGGGAAAAAISPAATFEKASVSRMASLLGAPPARRQGVDAQASAGSTFDQALTRFADATATRPEAMRAIGSAAAAVRQNPAAFLAADGSPKPDEVAALTRRELAASANTAPTVLGDLASADIEALAFLVLTQAAKSAQEDLKAVMAELKGIDDAKEQQRSSAADLRARLGPPWDGSGESSKGSGAADQGSGRGELSPAAAARLAAYLDRTAKDEVSLSAILARIGQTAAQITSNLK